MKGGVWFSIGLVIAFFMIQAPIHEIMHIMAAGFCGRQAEFASYNSVVVLGDDPIPLLVLYAGFWGEAILYTILGLGRKRKWLRWMASGLLAMTVLNGPFSDDFQAVTGSGWTQLQADRAILSWVLIWTPVAIAIFILNIRRDKHDVLRKTTG